MLSGSEQKILLNLSRRTLESLHDGDPRFAYEEFLHESIPLSDSLEAHVPCFVSLRTRSGQLRGCVGQTDSGRSLFANVHHTTLDSALHDPRFQPIVASEITNIRIEVSVLTPMVPLPSAEAIEIGRHGIFVRHQGKSAALLPSMAVGMGWKARDLLRAAAHEASLSEETFSLYEWFYFEEFAFREAGPLRLQ